MKDSFEQTEAFDREKSPIREAYLLLGAYTPVELSKLYTKEDQELVKSSAWQDYENPDFLTNKIKSILESADIDELTEDERFWRKEILWFWYHHAISYAISRHDREQAKFFASKALEYQGEDHPNKITKLLSLLVNDQIEEAKRWVENVDDDEKEAAELLIGNYDKGEI